jgi:hypothetical protein
LLKWAIAGEGIQCKFGSSYRVLQRIETTFTYSL